MTTTAAVTAAATTTTTTTTGILTQVVPQKNGFDPHVKILTSYNYILLYIGLTLGYWFFKIMCLS